MAAGRKKAGWPVGKVCEDAITEAEVWIVDGECELADVGIRLMRCVVKVEAESSERSVLRSREIIKSRLMPLCWKRAAIVARASAMSTVRLVATVRRMCPENRKRMLSGCSWRRSRRIEEDPNLLAYQIT